MNIPEIIKGSHFEILCKMGTLKQFAGDISVIDVIICTAGLILLGSWLLKTSLGRNALADSLPRRNNMHPFTPFIPLFIWFGAGWAATSFTRNLMPDLPDWQNAFLDNTLLCICAIVTIAVIIFLARVSFTRRLKGLGLNAKTIHKDFGAAFVNLLAAWPLVMLMIILTNRFGKIIWGQDFEMQPHQELELITAYPQLSVRVLIIVTAVVVVPTFEEMLFRGLFQTMIRSFLAKPWLAIVMSSALFAVAHANPGHWPALFALSICIGYAYEKSGSLFRPIFIHSFFNAVSIIAILNQ